MTLRTAHGNGSSALVRVETTPADELPTPNAETTAARLADRKRRGKPFEKGNRAAAGRKPALALLGVPVADVADPVYQRMLRSAANYRRKRVSELAAVHGHVTAGAASLIASSALALAGSRYCYALAARAKDPALIKLGSALANDARQAELGAWELCSREAAAKPKESMAAFWARVMGEQRDADASDSSDAQDDADESPESSESTDE